MVNLKKIKTIAYIFLVAAIVLNLGLLYLAAKTPSNTNPERISSLIEKVENGQVEISKKWAKSSLVTFQEFAFSSDQLIANLKTLVLFITISNVLLITSFTVYLLLIMKPKPSET